MERHVDEDPQSGNRQGLNDETKRAEEEQEQHMGADAV